MCVLSAMFVVLTWRLTFSLKSSLSLLIKIPSALCNKVFCFKSAVFLLVNGTTGKPISHVKSQLTFGSASHRVWTWSTTAGSINSLAACQFEPKWQSVQYMLMLACATNWQPHGGEWVKWHVASLMSTTAAFHSNLTTEPSYSSVYCFKKFVPEASCPAQQVAAEGEPTVVSEHVVR